MKSSVSEVTPDKAAKFVLPVVAAIADCLPDHPQALMRARAFAEPLLSCETLDTGENTLAHADAVANILKAIGGSEAMQAACYLVYTCEHLNKPQEVITKAFGANFAALAIETTKLVRVQTQARKAKAAKAAKATTAIDTPAAQQAAACFVEEPTLEIRGIREGVITRDEIRYGVAYARAQVSQAAITLSDITVTFPRTGQAEASLTARLRATAAGETADWIQEFNVGLTHAAEDRTWHIHRVATVDAVQWPGID